MRILIVEDERALCDTLVKSLKQKGYEVDACYDGDSALAGRKRSTRAHGRAKIRSKRPCPGSSRMRRTARGLGGAPRRGQEVRQVLLLSR